MRKVLFGSIIATALIGGAVGSAEAASLLIKNQTDTTIAAVWYRSNNGLRKVASFIPPGGSRYVRVSCGWARFQFDDRNNDELTYRPEYGDVCDIDAITIWQE